MSRQAKPHLPPPPGEPSAGETAGQAWPRTRFEVYGEEMIEKMVMPSGNSGRVYLPQGWVGKSVKIIRL